jgi:hypothetical protein
MGEMGYIGPRLNKVVLVLDGCLGPATSVRGADEAEAAGTHSGVLVAVFFGAFGSRTGDVEGGRGATDARWDGWGWMGMDVMRRT